MTVGTLFKIWSSYLQLTVTLNTSYVSLWQWN